MHHTSLEIRRTLLITITLFCQLRVFAQGVVFKEEIKLRAGNTEAMSFIAGTDSIALVLLDNFKIHYWLLSNKLDVLSKDTISRPASQFINLLGYSKEGIASHFFFTDRRKKEFFIRSITPGKRHVDKFFNPINRNEKFLECFTYQNEFYIATIIRGTSSLTLYRFKGSKLATTYQIDFSKQVFTSDYYHPDLYSALASSKSLFNTEYSLTKIDLRDPTPIEVASEQAKLYYFENKVFITLDNFEDKTQLITINLESHEHSLRFYKKESIPASEFTSIKTNSFLTQNGLFQVIASNSDLIISVKSLEQDSLLASYRVNKNDDIIFRNTPLFKEGNTFINNHETTELPNTKSFLRKMTSGQIGLSVYEKDNQYIVSVGGFKEVTRNNGMTTYSPGYSFSTPGGVVSVPGTFYHSPGMFGLDQYTNSRSVNFKSVLNKDFEHVKGELSPNAFDKIKYYQDNHSDTKEAKTIFKFGEQYFFGYYNPYEKNYKLTSFKW